MDATETSKDYISVSDHVISKIRSELVSNGELKLSLLNEIHEVLENEDDKRFLVKSIVALALETWQRKMIQAGVISGKPETESSSPGYAENVDIDAKELEMFIDNKHEGYGDIDALFSSTEVEMFTKNEYEGFYIPQKDGSGDGDIKPNINAPPPTNNEDDEELNENDDIEEEESGGLDNDDIPNLIRCQFDYVKKKTKTKNKSKSNYWDCKFKAGVMQINGKHTLFSEAKGDFDFDMKP